MTNEEIHEAEIDAQEEELSEAEQLENYQRYMRECCLLALVAQNYGTVIIRREHLQKYLKGDRQVTVSLQQKEDGHYELRVTDVVDPDEAIKLATH